MIERKLLHPILERMKSPEAIVVTGMRRVGKTTLLRQVFDRVDSDNKLFLDLENPLHQKYFEETDYEAIAYQLSVLGMHLKRRAHVFLDEIQFVRQMPSIVKYLSDHYQIKFFLTGSASFYLKHLFSESLAGRKFLYELYPLDFEEFLALKGESATVPHASITREPLYTHLQTLYKEYVEFGGFPGVVGKSSVSEKRDALNDIFASYFNKEVLQLGDFRNNQLVRDLMLLLLERIGSRLDVSKLSAELGVSRPTLKEYLAFLEGTYFVSFVRPYSHSRDVEIRGAPKFYACDSGLAMQIAKVEFGRVFENAIFHQLRMRTGALNYYRRKSGAEIDFIAARNKKKEAYEVKLKATARDGEALQRLARDLQIRDAHLISYRFSHGVRTRYGFQI